MDDEPNASLLVADWRRQVHALYAAVRAERSPQAAHAAWVAGRSELFNRHPASPRRPGQSLRHAPYDPGFRFVRPITAADADRYEVPTGTDGVVAFRRIGRFELPIGDGASLDVWWLSSYGGGLFVPVKDRSAGRLTYGAGRYLLDTVKGADLGRRPAGDLDRQSDRELDRDPHGDADDDALWVVDLNFAYNPSCVYDPAWACPLAPSGNHLLVDTPVGELLPYGYE